MNEYQYADDNAPIEHSPEAIVYLLRNGTISREEARRMLGLFDEAKLLRH